MGNCCRKTSKRNVILLLVGLDNAGKTVAVKGLAGENFDNSVPTVGFSTINLQYMNTNVTVYDLGGGPNIRGIWHRYFVDAHGVIFVIDASDYNRLNEAKNVLYQLLSHKKISGKPLLLLANKQDDSNALDEIDIIEKLNLEYLVNEQKCPTLIESCSAMTVSKKNKVDPGIRTGYQWLMNCILRDYQILNERVVKDIYEQNCFEKEVRRKQMLKHAEKISLQPEIDQIESMVYENPFKPINELLNDKKAIENKITSRPGSALSHSPKLHKIFVKENVRPKSALDGVKRHLENTSRRNSLFMLSNKTTPVTLITPRSPQVVHTNDKQKNGITENGHITMKTLTVTDLPNTIDSVETHDMFVLKKFKENGHVDPFISTIHRESDDVTWINKALKEKSVEQIDYDCIVKDVS